MRSKDILNLCMNQPARGQQNFRDDLRAMQARSDARRDDMQARLENAIKETKRTFTSGLVMMRIHGTAGQEMDPEHPDQIQSQLLSPTVESLPCRSFLPRRHSLHIKWRALEEQLFSDGRPNRQNTDFE